LANLFRGQTRNPNNPLEFHDYSVKIPFDSTNADYIRQQITELIRRTSVMLCLLGTTTYTSRWVKWELATASALGKGLAGLRLHNSSIDVAPPELSSYEIVNWDSGIVTNTIERAAARAGY